MRKTQKQFVESALENDLARLELAILERSPEHTYQHMRSWFEGGLGMAFGLGLIDNEDRVRWLNRAAELHARRDSL